MKVDTMAPSDQTLIAEVAAGKRREDKATAAFIAVLVEAYRRRLHLELGFSLPPLALVSRYQLSDWDSACVCAGCRCA